MKNNIVIILLLVVAVVAGCGKSTEERYLSRVEEISGLEIKNGTIEKFIEWTLGILSSSCQLNSGKHFEK